MSEAIDTENQEQAKTLGLQRWVLMFFLAAGAMFFWLTDKAVIMAWSKFDEPMPVVSTLGSAIFAAIITIRVYKQETVNRLSYEVVGELSKVTWPSREETQVSTGVVIITSLIAAAILGVFDLVWSTVTDYIY